MFTLYWTASNRQHDINMGTYETEAEAKAAIPRAKEELYSQETDDTAWIDAGSWDIVENNQD